MFPCTVTVIYAPRRGTTCGRRLRGLGDVDARAQRRAAARPLSTAPCPQRTARRASRADVVVRLRRIRQRRRVRAPRATSRMPKPVSTSKPRAPMSRAVPPHQVENLGVVQVFRTVDTHAVAPATIGAEKLVPSTVCNRWRRTASALSRNVDSARRDPRRSKSAEARDRVALVRCRDRQDMRHRRREGPGFPSSREFPEGSDDDRAAAECGVDDVCSAGSKSVPPRAEVDHAATPAAAASIPDELASFNAREEIRVERARTACGYTRRCRRCSRERQRRRRRRSVEVVRCP